MRKHVPILSSIRPKTASRFLAKLRQEGDCLVFTGTRNKRGYGFVDVSYENKSRRYPILAHRLAYALHHGKDPDSGLIVCHRCNNPPCCNPDHLYLGTQQDNVNDMMKAGTNKFDRMKGIKGVSHPASDYSQATKDHVKELIREHRYVSRVSRLTGIPAQTLYRWRDE